MTKIAELREFGVADLEQREHDLAREIFDLRIQKSMGQEEKAGKLKERRRDFAKVKTLIRERALAAADTDA